MHNIPIIRAVPTGETKTRSYNGDYMKAGRKAEEIVLGFLRERPEIVGVEDLRELRVMHEADVDCALYTRDGRVPLAEIKSDVYLGNSGNVLFEILRINHTCVPEKAGALGWSLRSPATYFFYYAPTPNKIYQCRADDLRGAFQRYTREERAGANPRWINTDSIKSTLVVLIPWDYCKGIFTIYDLPDDEEIPF